MQWPKECFVAVEKNALGSEHFQTSSNRILFDCLRHVWNQGKPIELIAFTEDLRQRDILASVGGVGELSCTWVTSHSPEIVGYYIELIMEAHAKRMLAIEFGEVLKEVNSPANESSDIIQSAVSRLNHIKVKSADTSTMLDNIEAIVTDVEEGKESKRIISTGIKYLDKESPLSLGDMPIIAGQRKAGKSTLALTIALNVARNDLPVLLFSLEEDRYKVTRRLLSGISRVPFPELAKDDSKMFSAATALSQLSVTVRDDCRELVKITAVIREFHSLHKKGMAIVDYAQIVDVERRKDRNREQEVAEISRSLRSLAIELEIPILVLIQLNDDNRARESRSLEQDCTACWQISMPQDQTEAEGMRFVTIPYQRNGPSGVTFKVSFLGAIARIENYAKP
jgi:replicative DNA helicase